MSHFNIFCQSENMVEVKMNRYAINEGLKSKLTEILDKVKPKDSKLTFIINVSGESDDEYLISLGTTYDVDVADNNYVGFFVINEKLFLIFKNIPEEFFKLCGKEALLINATKPKKHRVIVEPYIDELPHWIFRFHKASYINIYSAY